MENNFEDDTSTSSVTNKNNIQEIFSTSILKEDFSKYKLLSPLLEIHDTPKSVFIKSKN